jgi:hypothetical protein
MAGKRVTYKGPHDRVEVELGGGATAAVDRNGTIEVPAAVADSLAQQEDWSLHGSKRSGAGRSRSRKRSTRKASSTAEAPSAPSAPADNGKAKDGD